ncbi:MAG: hypothetical protein WC369_07655 [Dehalococcoidales bacterium]|jgi:hypothetical protein
MADTVSPEERLFNIIKDGKDSGSGGGVSKPKKPSLDSSGIKKFFGSLKLHPGANKIDPKSVNRILSVALAAAAAFFVYYLFSTRPDAGKITRPAPKAGAALKLEIEGSMEQVVGFLYQLNGSPQLLRTEKMSLNPKDKDSEIVKSKINVTKVVMP